MSDYECSGERLALPALLDEPVVQLLMERDGVARDEVLSLAEEMRERLAARAQAA